MITLDTPIIQVQRIGPIFQKKLKKLGIETIRDILYHFPHRYEDFSNVKPIARIKFNEKCCIAGKILEIKDGRTWKKKMPLANAIIQDETGTIEVIWFNQPYITKTLKKGDYVCMAGKISLTGKGAHLSSPAYEKISATNNKLSVTNLTHAGRIVPVYPETEKLSSRWLRYIIMPLLTNLKNKIPEALPAKIIKENNFLAIDKALWQIHFPDSIELAKKAKQRFSFEELFNIQLAVLKERMLLDQESANAIPFNVDLIKRFVGCLPFKLTDAQRKSAFQILKDMEKPHPMNRLLEGDVGSGKTIVALIAALQTIKAGYQVAFMAPTEILAKQHFKEISTRLQNLRINIGFLTSKEDEFISRKLKNQTIEISRQKLLEKTKKGEIDILLGTHALIQDKIKFGGLGLVVLDEQHRFGVNQRAKLCKNATSKKKWSKITGIAIPHLLSMTATPIPRTLALTIYGDLDLSIIDQLPKGRKKIKTEIIPPKGRKKIYTFIKNQVKKGRQIFVICPRIEGEKTEIENPETKLKNKTEKKISPWANVKAVEEEYEKLSKEIFPELKVEMLHGKMTPKEKEKIMLNFKNKKFDILVSTSVIEVGIDIPNASVMMIEGSDRFGLAQLHQFRGRVGRSKYQSYCFLLTDSFSQKTRQRLNALITAKNGFELSEKDLEIRGPGDFSGTRQWGIPDLIMNSLKDMALVEKTRQLAKELLEQDPELKKHPALRDKLTKFRQKIHLE